MSVAGYNVKWVQGLLILLDTVILLYIGPHSITNLLNVIANNLKVCKRDISNIKHVHIWPVFV